MPRHPVHELLAEAAYAGREVTQEEVAELKLSPTDAERVRKASRQAAFLHAGHEQARAHEHARLRAQEIVAQLPEEQRDPRYLHEPEQYEGLGPAELADRVVRHR